MQAIVTYVSMIAAMLTGVILACIRCREPYFKFLIKQQVKEYFGVLMSEKEIAQNGGMLNDTVGTFLTSSLNVELVHVILVSIGRSGGKLRPNSNYLDYTKKDFCQTKEHLITSFKIYDPEKWKVAKLTDFLVKNHELSMK